MIARPGRKHPGERERIGGYLNLLEKLDQSELRAQVLASILGVAGPNPPAGWYQGTVTAPVSLAQPGNRAHWTNITGLVAGVTTLGDELGLLYAAPEVAASALREQVHWMWDGTKFTAPPGP